MSLQFTLHEVEGTDRQYSVLTSAGASIVGRVFVFENDEYGQCHAVTMEGDAVGKGLVVGEGGTLDDLQRASWAARTILDRLGNVS